METICYNRSRQFGGKQTGLKELIVHRGNTPHQLLHTFSPREGYFTLVNSDESNEENNSHCSYKNKDQTEIPSSNFINTD